MLTTSPRPKLWCWMFFLAIHACAQNYATGYQTSDNTGYCPPGYQNVNGYCLRSLNCPAGYYLGTDEKCYQQNALVCPTGYYLGTDGQCYPQNALVCPTGYYLNTDGKCYLKDPLPCPFEPTTVIPPVTTQPTTTTTTEEPSTTTTEEPTTTTTEEPSTTTTEEPTTTTTEPPPPPVPPRVERPVELARCPPGSIFFEEQCRRIVCTEGEYYAGRCLLPACPAGTVWHGGSCQEPGYITTILEIDNVIRNQHEYTVATENINRVEYSTLPPYDEAYDKSYDATTRHEESNDIIITTTKRPWLYPTGQPTTMALPPTSEVFPGRNPPPGCCLVKSPRICINYAPNWVCSSRERKLCDPRVCTNSVIYLKPPQIVESENRRRLVMPPNPPLQACSTPECKESEFLDCSGCKHDQRDKCSPSCYSYYCPNGSCSFMNSQDYCGIYPSGFGCNADDGCIWDWCHKKCY
ncbi:GL21691 [Drosophila persimilis]|uniref:GL21691 n=1 Tax=Drosophila persimilis TaxID=7234 RepID=B4GF39_DROPE|nr:GL21691 [Drosophila persimilis]